MSETTHVSKQGTSESPTEAIKEAAIQQENLPIAEGQIVEVTIVATWTTPDGQHHALVTAEVFEDPDFQLEIQSEDGAENAQQAIENSISESPFLEDATISVKIESVWQTPDGKWHANVSLDAAPEEKLKDGGNVNLEKNNVAESHVSPDIKTTNDGLTDNDPKIDSSALELTPAMASAEEELEKDFDVSRDPNSKRSQDLKDRPKPEGGYHSEGLRREDQPELDKKTKPKLEETPN